MNSQGIKTGIISGVIGSLIVIIFIQPILSFTWNAVIGISSQVHHGYVDHIYRNAALGDRNLIGHLTALYVIMIFPLGGVFFMLRWQVNAPNFTAVGRFLNAMLGFVDRYSNPILSLTCLTTAIVMLVGVSLSVGTMEISSSFNQRLTVLTPGISDAEYETFRARWANMRSETDYNAIVANMEARAKELGVTLPKLRTP
jgi:hypothetical protein